MTALKTPIEEIRELAAVGDIHALRALGYSLIFGGIDGVERDPDQGLELLHDAAWRGEVWPMNTIVDEPIRRGHQAEDMGKSWQGEQFYEAVYWLLCAIRLGDKEAKERLENAKVADDGCDFTPESALGFHCFINSFENSAPDMKIAAVH